MVDAWAEMRDRGTTAMLAYRRDDVADLVKGPGDSTEEGRGWAAAGFRHHDLDRDGPVDLAVGDRSYDPKL